MYKGIYNLIHDHNERMKEECGVIGVCSKSLFTASQMVYYGLYSLQHRGQESAGIAVSNNGVIDYYKDMGLVSEIFNQKKIDKLEGNLAIGHIRYSTTGGSLFENAQPLIVNFKGTRLALVHNGNIMNSNDLRAKMEAQGTLFQTTTDTEIIANLIARNYKNDIVEAIQETKNIIKGAYTLVILYKDQLIGVRDNNGIRPLCLGKIEDGYVLASESCALDTISAEFIRDIEAGEIVILEKDQIQSVITKHNAEKKLCVFELVYFARPDSFMDTISAQSFRYKSGKILARQMNVEADIVIGVPDSGISGAIGYAEESGIPYGIGLVKNRYVGRTFIQPTQSLREKGVMIKLNVLRKTIKDKRVVILDDSIVRGTTSRRLVEMLRNAGAKEIHFRVTSPPVAFPCFYGIDIPTRHELIASQKTKEEIRQYIGVDTLDYMTPEGLREAASNKTTFCDACFTGKYPIL